MIRRIAHLADIHISNEIKRHDEYREQFSKLHDKLNEFKPDRIVISGDLFQDKLHVNNEAKVLAGEFITMLTGTCKVVLTVGNHDFNIKSSTRVSSTDTIVKLINNDNLLYLTRSGFYQDDNVAWVNHSHLEKKINPWTSIAHTRDESLTYIDLFHDPVNGCTLDNGTTSDKPSHRKLTDFDGDYGMFGDIHLFQYLDKKKTKAYCGSLIQQNHGEPATGHGFIAWDIQTGESKHIDIPNENTLVTIELNVDQDYDKLPTTCEHATSKSSFRVAWTDYKSAFVSANEEKIKKHIRDTWGTTQPVKFKKNKIFKSVSSVTMLTESINVADKTVQQDIFREFLKLNNYSDATIESVLSIDDSINARLNVDGNDMGINWNIDRFWFDNFKSYDSEDVDWNDINGIVKIEGRNQAGKSTLLDTISYILYGTTLFTSKLGGDKKVKHADARYINNKRDLDHCSGGAILDINGVKYTIERKTTREWTKNRKSISSVSTTVNYHEGLPGEDTTSQNDENRMKTQKVIENVLGEFEDFVRLSLTNADNLNSLLSIDRATFIDSIVKDAGYIIFEKKLEEFKKFKKEVEENDIKLDLDSSKAELDDITSRLDELSILITSKKDALASTKSNMSNLLGRRDTERTKLTTIDGDVANLDINQLNNRVVEFNNSISKLLTDISTNTTRASRLTRTCDKDSLDGAYKKLKAAEEELMQRKLKISSLNNEVQEKEKLVLKVESKISELKNNEVNRLKSTIKDTNNRINELNNEFNGKVNLFVSKVNADTDLKNSEIKRLQDGKKANIKLAASIQASIDEIMASDVCYACERPHDEKYLAKRAQTVAGYQEQIDELNTKNDAIDLDITSIMDGISSNQELVSSASSKNYPGKLGEMHGKMLAEVSVLSDEIDGINKVLDLLANGDLSMSPELSEKIENGMNIKTSTLADIERLTAEIKTLKSGIPSIEQGISSANDEVSTLEDARKEQESRMALEAENKNLALKIDNIRLNIENINGKLAQYEKHLDTIEKNKLIQAAIDELDDEIETVEKAISSASDELAKLDKDSTILSRDKGKLESSIIKYTEQTKRNEVMKVYQSCVHRDGIPNMLILRSRDLINKEISDLLCECNFDIYLDEELDLKLSDQSTGAVQSLLGSSGMERTFGAVALKLALRSINAKSKNNFMFFDEIYGKIDTENIPLFNEMLMTAKKFINKIVIIEHHADITPDCLFNITKDEDGISHLQITK